MRAKKQKDIVYAVWCDIEFERRDLFERYEQLALFVHTKRDEGKLKFVIMKTNRKIQLVNC